MAWTFDTFVASYSEFAEERRDVVTAKLAESVRRVSATVWGTMTDDGVALLAAHLLTMIPHTGAGYNREVTWADGSTSYLTEFKRLERIVASSHRVIPHEDEDDDVA